MKPSDKSPLQMYEAINAVQIAEAAGAEKYTPDILAKAKEELTNAQALEIGRGILLVAIALSGLLVPAWRVAYNRVTEGAGFLRRTLIVGSGALARELAGAARSRPDLGLQLVGMLARDRSEVRLAAWQGSLWVAS